MKKLIICIACLSVALGAWAAWPKENNFAKTNPVYEDSATPASGSGWYIDNDSCKKCVIYPANTNDPNKRNCGRCHSSMNTEYTGRQSNGYAYYKATCNNRQCGHVVSLKLKL